VLSNVSVRAGFRYAEITWDTDEVSNSFVQVINAVSETLTVATGDLKTSHAITVTDTTFLPAGANDYTAIAGSTDPVGNTSESAPVPFTTEASADNTAPSVPTGLTATAGSDAIYLSWDGNTEPDFGSYQLFRSGSDTVQIASGITATSYVDNSVANDSTYHYFLQAVDRAIPVPNVSTSSPSVTETPSVSASPSAPALSAPSGDATVSLKPVLVTENATPGTSGGTLSYTFAVYADPLLTQLVASISGIPEGVPGNPTHWQVIDPAIVDSVVLEDGVRYWWRAHANNGVFDGPWSDPDSFTASSSVPTGISDASSNVPERYALSQNFPNPFNPSTRIQYALPRSGLVTIVVYNVLGQEVRTLLRDQPRSAGFHHVTWHGRNASERVTGSGVYFYRIVVRDPETQQDVYTRAKKMLLVK
jgi:hypothetical protein